MNPTCVCVPNNRGAPAHIGFPAVIAFHIKFNGFIGKLWFPLVGENDWSEMEWKWNAEKQHNCIPIHVLMPVKRGRFENVFTEEKRARGDYKWERKNWKKKKTNRTVYNCIYEYNGLMAFGTILN